MLCPHQTQLDCPQSQARGAPRRGVAVESAHGEPLKASVEAQMLPCVSIHRWL